MRSSISSSDPASAPSGLTTRHYRRYAGLFLIGASLLYLGAEVVTQVGLPRISRIEQRTESDLEGAFRLRDPDDILLVGNSLLGTGVDVGVLNESLGGRWVAHRLHIENTRYYDWYYGLHYLLDSGCRPGTIVVVFNVRGLLDHSARGEYMVGRLARWRDIHRLARDLDYDLTQTSNLYVAKASRFYASRTEIRANLLSRLIPRFEDIRGDLTPTRKPFPPDEEALGILGRRVEDLHALAARYGVRLVMAIPPTLAEDGREDLALRAGSVSGVPCVVPLPRAQTTRADFEPDGLHLDAPGAVRFSKALSVALKTALAP